MDVVTLIIAAGEEECADLAGSANPLNNWSGFEAPGMDTLRIASLHSLLTGDSLQASLDAYEPAYVGNNETVVIRLSDELLERLLELDDEEIETLVDELAASEAFEQTGSDVEEVLFLLESLTDLAGLAESQGQVLFLWMSFPELMDAE